MKMCNAIAGLGNRVSLLIPRDSRRVLPDVSDPYRFYGVERCFEILEVPFPRVRGGLQLYGWIAARRASRLKPDIVYSRNVTGAYRSARLGMPVVFEMHRPMKPGPALKELIFRAMLRQRAFRMLVVITRALAAVCRDEYPAYSPATLVMPDGADMISEHVQPAVLDGARRGFNVGYSGSMLPGKGMEVIIPLARRCAWADFHIWGGTDDDIVVMRQRAAGTENIHFYGFVPPAQLPSNLLACDVLLLPNQPSVEAAAGGADIGQWTSPLKAFEYMATGNAILCSRLPVLEEVFVHRRNCLLCGSDDIGEWESALLTLRSDTELRTNLGREARDSFLRRFTWHARARRLMEELRL